MKSFRKGSNINIYSSSNHSVPTELISFNGKIFAQIAQDEPTYERSLEAITTNRLHHSAETIIFCSISENGELSAIKLRNPKESPRHLGFDRGKERVSQVSAFQSPDDLLDYFQDSALVPVYLNSRNESGERIALRENTAAKTIVQDSLLEEFTRLKATPKALEEFYKNQLKYSLIRASSIKKTETVLAIIEATTHLQDPAEILNHPDGVGNSAFVWAAGVSGDIDTSRKLLTAGANINQATYSGGTALIFAVLNGQEGIVEYLVEENAGINDFASAYGGTALTYALTLEESESKTSIVKSLLQGLVREKKEFEEKYPDQKFELKGKLETGKITSSSQDLLESYLDKLEPSQAVELKSLVNNLMTPDKELTWVERIESERKSSIKAPDLHK